MKNLEIYKIVSEYDIEKYLTEGHFDFIFNEILKYIDIKKCDIQDIDVICNFFEKIKEFLIKEKKIEEYGQYFIDFIFHTVYNCIIESDYDKQFTQIFKIFLNKNRDLIKSVFGIKNNFAKEKTFICYLF